jgi:hypothetical protein
MNQRKKIIGLIFICFLSISFYLFNTNYTVNNAILTNLGFVRGLLKISATANHIFNALDFSKLFIPVTDKYVIDIKASYDDLKSFDQSYRCSTWFLEDRCKSWRKVNFANQGFDAKVKIKIAGTSKTPWQSSLTIGQWLNRKLNKDSIYNPVNSGYSFFIKTEKDLLFENMRLFTLLSPYDDWSFFSQVMNFHARKFGLITTYGRPFIMRLNGSDAGVYLLQEKIGKDLLERDYGITDFAILKSNDDWDKIPLGHVSNTDYSTEDKEQSGTSDRTIGLAQNQLRRLFNEIRKGNISEVGRLVDLEYMAKLSAFEMLYGTKHSSFGDNRRYIFNLADGRFYPSFRMEGNPVLLETEQNLIPKIYDSDKGDELIDLLLSDTQFKNRQTYFISKLVALESEFKKDYAQYLLEYNDVLNMTSRPSVRVSIRNDMGFSIYQRNIEILKSYLSYNKIFITRRSFGLACDYSIFVDSFAPISLNDQLLNRGRNIYNTLGQCDKKLIFRNESTNSLVLDKNIYSNFEFILDEPGTIEKIFQYSDNGKVITVKKGQYVVDQNIQFPRDRNVVLEAGTEIYIAENKSIIFHNEFSALGTRKNPILINPKNNSFGSVLIKANNRKVSIRNLSISGGSEGYIDNTFASGQFVIVHGDVNIEHSKFSYSNSDDGINIKYSKVDLRNNFFEKNRGDQIDLDYCNGSVIGNSFEADDYQNLSIETDGLDVSGSKLAIANNKFKGFTDKAISVGEKSTVIVSNNRITNSNIGIAVKDESLACIVGNRFVDNREDLAAYVKKMMYKDPKIFAVDSIWPETYEFVGSVEACDEVN